MYRGAVPSSVVLRPKTKCCESKDKCSRCPLRLLKDGCLPDGYAVHRRKLVRTTASGSGKISKSELDKAVKRTAKERKRARRAA